MLIRLAEDLARALVPGTFASILQQFTAVTDEQGYFAFPPIGGAEGSTLTAHHEGFEFQQIPLPEASTRELVVTMFPYRSSAALAGHVWQQDGQPAAGAYVSAGDDTVRCDEAGAFALQHMPKGAPRFVRAILPGTLPGEVDVGELTPSECLALEIVLGPPALKLAGRVVDAEGKPVEGAFVWTSDGERFGNVPTELGRITFQLTFDLEGVIAGAGLNNQAGGRRARTDAAGGFELSSLADRRYALFAQHPSTFELAGPLSVSAGSSSAELSFAGEPHQRVAGRVLSFSGEPLAGAKVAVQRTRSGETSASGSFAGGDVPAQTTDADGRFAFEDLCTTGTELRIGAKDAPNETHFALADHQDWEHLELLLAATCHLRVHLSDPGFADALELHDERDQSLGITFDLGGIRCMSESVQIQRGISDVLITDEKARTLVLFKDNEEVERMPLHLVPDRINEVEL